MTVNKSLYRPMTTLLGLWVGYLLVLATLQTLDAGVGFKIWPIGEDRNWLYILDTENPWAAFKAFWSLDHRNPLAAVWWLIASPVIESSDWGLHAISLIVSPIAATATFLTLDRLAKGNARLFCILVAILVLFWSMPARHDHVDRVMVIALIYTLLSIYSFTSFMDGGEKRFSLLLCSLACYAIALATYTLQSGTVLLIPFLAIFRSDAPIKRRLILAAFYSSLYLLGLIAYTLLWMYFSRSSGQFSINAHMLITQSVQSVIALLLPPYNAQMYDLATIELAAHRPDAWLAGAVAFACVTLGAAWMIDKGKTHAPPIAWCLLLLTAIVAPTILVEAGNANWGPASRSIMLMQVWQPLFLMTMGVSLFSLIPSKVIQLACTSVLFLALATVVIFVNLGFNHYQTDLTVYQRNLGQALRKLDAGRVDTMNYLVKIKNPVSEKVGSEPLLISYAPTILDRKNTFLRIIPSYPSPVSTYDSIWRIRFTDQGVGNAALSPVDQLTPYEQIQVVEFDGLEATVLKTVTEQDMEGLQVDWERSSPFSQ